MSEKYELPLSIEPTPLAFLQSVLKSRDECRRAGNFGPLVVIVPAVWRTFLRTQYHSAMGDKTIIGRLLEIEGIERVAMSNGRLTEVLPIMEDV